MQSGGRLIEFGFVLVKSEMRVFGSSNCLDVNYVLRSELSWAGCGAGCRETLQQRPEDAASPRLPGAMGV